MSQYIYIYVHVLFSGRGADEVLHVGLPGLLRFLRALPELRARGERWQIMVVNNAICAIYIYPCTYIYILYPYILYVGQPIHKRVELSRPSFCLARWREIMKCPRSWSKRKQTRTSQRHIFKPGETGLEDVVFCNFLFMQS